jgi:hypothetical protein
MKATIKQINKTPEGYAVMCDIEGRNPRQFNYPEDTTQAKIKDAIRAYLLELKAQEGKLPQFRTALIGNVIEV